MCLWSKQKKKDDLSQMTTVYLLPVLLEIYQQGTLQSRDLKNSFMSHSAIELCFCPYNHALDAFFGGVLLFEWEAMISLFIYPGGSLFNGVIDCIYQVQKNAEFENTTILS